MESPLPPEVFYGLLRQDLPSELDKLLEHEDDEFTTALETAVDESIIPRRLNDSIDERIAQLRELRNRRSEWTRYLRHAQLLDEQAAESDRGPPAGFTVNILDVETETDVGSFVTDGNGRFAIPYGRPQGESFVRTLRVRITDPSGDEVALDQETYEVDLAANEVWSLWVSLPEVPPPDAIDLEEREDDIVSVFVALGQEVDGKRLLSDLQSRPGFSSLADIRRARGLNNVPDLSVPIENEAVQLLDGLSNLSTLPSVTIENVVPLLDSGYHSQFVVADVSRREFVERVADPNTLPESTAVRIHAEGVAQQSFLDNEGTSMLAEWANGRLKRPEFTLGDVLELNEVGRTPCPDHCDDCDAAVSPRAYLADLIEYVLKHTRISSDDQRRLFLNQLVEHFHQPFDAFPASCEATSDEILHVRACIEVLRAHLGPSQMGSTLQASEITYRQRAYEQLLHAIGTSVDELEETLDEPSEDEASSTKVASRARRRKQLADRIDVYYDETTSHLEELRFETGVTEADLGRVFGLTDTTAPTTEESDGKRRLRSREPPELQRWRLGYERQTWKRADWDHDPYATGDRPVVDPDVVSIDDLRQTGPGASKVHEIWKKRRTWVDEQLTDVAATPGDRSAEQALTSLCDPFEYDGRTFAGPWQGALEPGECPSPQELETIRSGLSGDGPAIDEAVTDRLEDLGMDQQRLGRLVDLHAKDQRSDESLSPQEWDEIRSILVQRRKEVVFDEWVDEERTEGVTFGATFSGCARRTGRRTLVALAGERAPPR